MCLNRLQQGKFSAQSTEEDENPDAPESTEADGESSSIRRSQRKRKEISYKGKIMIFTPIMLIFTLTLKQTRLHSASSNKKASSSKF
jgi:hypothetical protein